MSENNGWFPIETAPRDGACILAYYPLYRSSGLSRVRGTHITIVSWNVHYEDNDGMGWVEDDGLMPYALPSHWRPLPAPPANAG